MGVPDRPTADLAIEWLKRLPAGQPLAQDDARRVRSLLGRHAWRIWQECGHWLNLAREWVPVAELEYALTMQTLTEYSHLHEWVKQKTADLQRLPAETTESSPFSELPRLAGRIEERFHKNPLFPGVPEPQPWLTRFGVELSRIELDDEVEMQRLRALAVELANTEWQTAPALEIIPYIDGAPAGTPKRVEVVWLDRALYVENLPKAKLARLVPERLGKSFGRTDVTAALNYCFGRSSDDVAEYLEENFHLGPRPAPSASEARPDVTGSHVPSESEPATADTDTAVHAGASGDGASDGPLAPESIDDEAEPAETPEPARGDVERVDPVPAKDRPAPKPAKASIMERFARSQGFQKDGEDRFFYADGSWIGKAHDSSFPWERRTARGELVRHYWPKDHCLELQPLQLEADIWGLIDKFPDRHSLILSTPQGDPVEVPGARLRAMRESGELTLYPATYRLVLDHDRKQ
jgi:hypothetical protein